MKLVSSLVLISIIIPLSICWADADWSDYDGWVDEYSECWFNILREDALIDRPFHDETLPTDWELHNLSWQQVRSGNIAYVQISAESPVGESYIQSPFMDLNRPGLCRASGCDQEYVDFRMGWRLGSDYLPAFRVLLGFTSGDDLNGETISWEEIWSTSGGILKSSEQKNSWFSVEDLYDLNKENDSTSIIFKIEFTSIETFIIDVGFLEINYYAQNEKCETHGGYWHESPDDDDDNDDSECSIVPDNQSTHFGLAIIMLIIGIAAMVMRRK